MAAITRLGSGGYGTRRTGSFAGREEVVVIPPVVAETYSGGWSHPARPWPAEETDIERERRVKAERVRLGILAPDPGKPAALEAAGATIAGGAATLASPEAPDYGLAADLAGLYAGAWLDQEIKRYFEIQDDDDAAVLLLAIAALY